MYFNRSSYTPYCKTQSEYRSVPFMIEHICITGSVRKIDFVRGVCMSCTPGSNSLEVVQHIYYRRCEQWSMLRHGSAFCPHGTHVCKSCWTPDSSLKALNTLFDEMFVHFMLLVSSIGLLCFKGSVLTRGNKWKGCKRPDTYTEGDLGLEVRS